jgi:hypothetical protein
MLTLIVHLRAASSESPLSDEQEKEIEKILGEEREYYRKRGLISEKAWSLYE